MRTRSLALALALLLSTPLLLPACGQSEIEETQSTESTTVKKAGGGGGPPPFFEMCDCRYKFTKPGGDIIYNCSTPKDHGFGHICVWPMKCPNDKQFGTWYPYDPTDSMPIKDDFGCYATVYAFLGDPIPPGFFEP